MAEGRAIKYCTQGDYYRLAYLEAAIAMTLGVHTSTSFLDCNLFQMGCFVATKVLLTSAIVERPRDALVSRNLVTTKEFFVNTEHNKQIYLSNIYLSLNCSQRIMTETNETVTII